MLYRSKKDLPDPIKKHLPAAVQELYKEAFNNAWNQYKNPSKREDTEALEKKLLTVSLGSL